MEDARYLGRSDDSEQKGLINEGEASESSGRERLQEMKHISHLITNVSTHFP